jgi:dUTPase
MDEFGKWHEYFTYLAPRSSIRGYNLLMTNSMGVIDRGYRSAILACFAYKTQGKDLCIVPSKSHISPDNEVCTVSPLGFGIKINPEKIYKIGDKIAQLIVTPQPDVYIEQRITEWDVTDRGNKGHGSSGL